MTRRTARVTWTATGEPQDICFGDVCAVFRLWLRAVFPLTAAELDRRKEQRN